MSMLPVSDNLSYAVGNPDEFVSRPLRIFASPVRHLLERLSEQLLSDSKSKSMPDVISFAWWCRKANLERLADKYSDGNLRLGRGLAFHITPANMPVNFAFSWAFSLLAGNANVVRLPRREFPQILFLVKHVNEILKCRVFSEIKRMNVFVDYDKGLHQVTEAFSERADIRVIWGGDSTIQAMKKIPTTPRTIDVCFADRYSICALGSTEVLRLGEQALARLARKFFSDAYIMDQSACSSPHLVIWIGNDEESEVAGKRFWNAVQAEVERRYQISTIRSVDKFTQACRDAIELDGIAGLVRTDNRLIRVRLRAPFQGIENRRSTSGYFYEWYTRRLDSAAYLVTNKYQTLIYFGLPKDLLASFVLDNRLSGIDRIVPVGAGLDLGLTWDGYDLISMLSRVCDLR